MLTKMIVRRSAVLAMALLAIATSGAVTAQAADDEAELPDYSKKGADTCFQCHDDQAVLAVFRTKHAAPDDPNSPFGHGQLQCEACHGPGTEHSREGQSKVGESVCLGCHTGEFGEGFDFETYIQSVRH